MTESIENSWVKLESVLNTGNHASKTRSTSTGSSRVTRPITAVKLRSSITRVRQLSFRDPTTPSSRNISSVNESREIRSRPVTAPLSPSNRSISTFTHIEGLPVSALQRIYKAKCEDLNIPILLDQERRFLAYCMRHFKHRRFVMRDVGVGPEAAKVIGEVLKSNVNFSRVELGKNMIGDAGIIQLANNLLKNLNIVHLDLSSNCLTPEGTRDFLTLIANHGSLSSIDISSHEGLNRNRLCAYGAEPFATILKQNALLSMLNLAGTSLGVEGIVYIAEGLYENSSVVYLNVANNTIGARGAEILAKVAAKSKLIELNLSGNRIGNEGVDYVSALLGGTYEGGCSIVKLDLSKNEITSKGAGKIYSSLKTNGTLTHLNLEGNPFGAQSTYNLYSFLADNVVLSQLNLSNCELRNDFAIVLSDGLGKNRGLLNINLSHNIIEDVGISSLAQGLLRNYSLKCLDLSSNRIQNPGGLALANALKMNRSIEQLNLRDNNIRDEAGQLFSEVSRFNRSLIKLVLEYNPISYKYIRDIHANMKENRAFYRKSLAPMLKRKIQSMQINENAIPTVYNKIEAKKKEKQDAMNRLKTQAERMSEVKVAEEKKISTLLEELNERKKRNTELSQQVMELQDQVRHEDIALHRIQTEWTEKIAKAVNEVKNKEKRSKV